ncbi:MAG TPA: 5-amino-6-(D-ribitylamino)uracil--L-tyrosine 4-hydroxyphenyl transferase CofH [Xanthobacteraceae bacterium]
MSDPSRFLPEPGQATEFLQEMESTALEALLERARARREAVHGNIISYSPKVFIPLTRLCRDACGYCSFARQPRQVPAAYLEADEIVAIARRGATLGCTEALFTLGERPEDRYPSARKELADLGYPDTPAYLAAMADLVQRETGLLAHTNPGTLRRAELLALRGVSVSQGLMLESTAVRLCDKAGPHYRCPDKHPLVRIATIAAAGELAIPFTTGILIGIGETRCERIEALLTIRNLHERFGHVQEVIVQNFRAKPGTRMAGASEPDFADLLWTAAVARLLLPPSMHVQVPPNLSFSRFAELLNAGIDDWGGISPVTPDYVNPEAPWPEIEKLRRATESFGATLAARLPVYPDFMRAADRWIDPRVKPLVLRQADGDGWARADDWSPGIADRPMQSFPAAARPARGLERVLHRAMRGERLTEETIAGLLRARGGEVSTIVAAADELRRCTSGDVVRYVVNRNINYTNICEYRCAFCAFSKGKTSDLLRGKPYNLSLDEVARRAAEAWERGATEVCMQGGIHPSFDGRTYLDLLRAVKAAAPAIHVHAFSPLEVSHGAATLGVSTARFLQMLADNGLGSLPGTAAEILDDGVRAVLCPDKLSASQWLDVIETAHRLGLRTTATIMFGHLDAPVHWARHLLHIRDLQERTGGFTEFVPLPFVHMEAPMFLRGIARRGPTSREAILMHAVSRLALHALITNVQVSWVKLGVEGACRALAAGANDLGGTLMNESISRAAGTEHGQELPPEAMDRLITGLGRRPQQRTTLYGPVDDERRRTSYRAAPLVPALPPPSRGGGLFPASVATR